MGDILNYEIYGNSLVNYFIAIVFFLIILLGFKIWKKLLVNILGKRPESYFNTSLQRQINLLPNYILILVSLFFSVRVLFLSPSVSKLINTIFSILISFEIVVFSSRIWEYLFYSYMSKKGKLEPTIMNMFKTIINIVLGAIFIIIVLINLDINIWPLIASLWVVSVSFAFAFKSVLEDISSAFSIYIQKPFRIWDFIVWDKYSWTVKKISLKTTILNSIDWQTVIIPNKDLVNGIINNYGNMKKRRVVFNVFIKYKTTSVKIEKIPDIISKLLEKITDVQFEICFCKEITWTSYKFEIIYFVLSKEYNVYAEKQQEINLKINDYFEKNNIDIV